ncbi:MAG: hypothetical protein WC967_13455 [Balneolaceae bacterium]
MAITKTTIKSRFPNAERIEQVKSKQLFIVYYVNFSLLVSYTTVIGYKEHGSLDNKWNITNRKYSQSTSRQVTYFHKYANYNTLVVADAEIQNFLEGIVL